MIARVVRKHSKDPGPAAWVAILPPAGAPHVLEEKTTCDWLVIGAGFTGLAAARRLAQICPGERIVVLEASRIAEGPAGRNSGFMIDLPHDLSSDDYSGGTADADKKQTAMNRAAITFASDAAEEYGFSKKVFDLCGKINGAATQKGLSLNVDFAEHLTAMGETYELLDAAAMADIVGTDYYKGELFTPGTAVLQPAAYIRGLAAGLGDGIVLYENSAAERFARVGDTWRIETRNGAVEAPKVILAVNGHVANRRSSGRSNGLDHPAHIRNRRRPHRRENPVHLLSGNGGVRRALAFGWPYSRPLLRCAFPKDRRRLDVVSLGRAPLFELERRFRIRGNR